MTIRQLKRLKKAYSKIRKIWINSNADNKDLVIEQFNDSIEQIDLEIQMILMAQDDCAYLDEAS